MIFEDFIKEYLKRFEKLIEVLNEIDLPFEGWVELIKNISGKEL